MAIYRFRVAFEDYDVVREIDIRSNQTFEDLHVGIHNSVGYKAEVPSSFFVSNDQWHKGEEITVHPNEKKITAGVMLMSDAKLLNHIEDPHQKFYYISNFDLPYDMHVELTKIALDANSKITYPVTVKSTGEPPKQFGVVPVGRKVPVVGLVPTAKEPIVDDLDLPSLADEPEVARFSLAELATGEGLDEEETERLDKGTLAGLSLDEGDEDSYEQEAAESEDGTDTDSEEERGFGGFGVEEDEDHPRGKDY